MQTEGDFSSKCKDKEFIDQKHINISNTIQDKYFTN